jgi:hypothetical protein
MNLTPWRDSTLCLWRQARARKGRERSLAAFVGPLLRSVQPKRLGGRRGASRSEGVLNAGRLCVDAVPQIEGVCSRLVCVD